MSTSGDNAGYPPRPPEGPNVLGKIFGWTIAAAILALLVYVAFYSGIEVALAGLAGGLVAFFLIT